MSRPEGGRYRVSQGVPSRSKREAHGGLIHSARRVVFALAYLGRKAQAVQEGQRGLALMPIRQDAFYGAYLQHQLAGIYILVGEPEKVLTSSRRCSRSRTTFARVAQDRCELRSAAKRCAVPEAGGRKISGLRRPA